ncbi:hypothetical protein B0J18DRAFT_440171 [Chaetomium sp. MPI-SDFR-AT-0129]|nr:hypothetical protein B0J18DRAFT_440171 [Chaetomium sp. MPI-SDFR-AT-0129]
MPGRTSDGHAAESSRKRARRGELGDGEEIVDVQRARSSLLQAESRKRIRLSDPEHIKVERGIIRDVTPVDDDADDDDANANDDPTSPNSPPKTQYELMRDNNFEHLRHAAADDQRATQRLRFRPSMLGNSTIAENGIIESVTCVNFMCHVRLHCELGPLLNFIVGENGSGKSAILTAITLCLGGKASSTNRGGSLKSFVKEGCERGVLIVRIKNQGQDAYKPDIYGDSVIVERHFSKSGSSGFKVKTAIGMVHSTKKQEVDELVEYYALQVDNPLNVLSQDNARQFLNASTKTQKYKFFIEGVQLQQLDNDYRLISESLEQMVAKVPDQQERVKLAKGGLDKAQRLMDELEGSRQVRIKLRTLRHQLAWCQVFQEEAELVQREKELGQAETQVAEAQQEVQAKNQALEVADEKVERAKNAWEAVKGEEEGIERCRAEAIEHHQQLKAEIAQLHAEEREAREQLKSKTRSVNEAKEKIAAEEARLQAANGDGPARKMRELEAAKENVTRIQTEMQKNRNREAPLENEIKAINAEVAGFDGEIREKRDKIDNIQTRINELEENRGTLWGAYERGVPELLERINNDSSFQTKPIGPLGAHVQLLKPEWSGILEKTIGGNLNAFVVSCKADETILSRLMRQCNVRTCPVIICNSRGLDTSRNEPDSEYDTILRVLEIENPLVRDVLVINNMIEQVILIPERVRAQEVMFDSAPPRNVKACLCFHDGRRDEGLRLTVTGNGISTSPIRTNTSARPRMKTGASSQIALLNTSKQHLVAEYKELNLQKSRRNQDCERRRKEQGELKDSLARLQDDLRATEAEINRIQDELDELEGGEGVLLALKNHLAELEKEYNHIGIQFGSLSAQKQDKNVVVEEAHQKVKEARTQVDDWKARLGKADAKVTKAKDVRLLCLVEKNDAIAKEAESVETRERAERRRARQAEGIQEMIDQARQVCEERAYVPEGETFEGIQRQYSTLHERLKRIENKRGMSDTEVHDYFARMQAAHVQVVADLESITEVNERLRSTLKLRLEKWRKFQRYISSQSRANFIYLLSERGFRGKLNLDHQERSLDLQVEPDKTEKRAAGRSTKTLSGGEKSFSSICLLLAIWEAMGSPLRCLDEFDVFMDNVNRAISTNMLITAARRSVNRQYIFITPNAIESRNTLDKDVKIIRLTDPRQRTLADH